MGDPDIAEQIRITIIAHFADGDRSHVFVIRTIPVTVWSSDVAGIMTESQFRPDMTSDTEKPVLRVLNLVLSANEQGISSSVEHTVRSTIYSVISNHSGKAMC